MTYVNRTDNEFYPLGDAGVDFDSRREVEAAPTASAHGLFFRGQVFENLAHEVQLCIDGNQPYSNLTIDALQVHNEVAWKEPHASLEAAIRFSNKSQEEAGEADAALTDFWEDGDPAALLEETGDFLWCVTAVASNAGVVVNDNLKTRLYDYLMGTKELRDGKFTVPYWYDAAGALAIKRGSITVGELDALISGGFVPRFSPAMNLYETETISPTAFVGDFNFYGVALLGLSKELYESGQDIYHQGDSQHTAAATIGKLSAETFLRAAAIASFAGSSLAHVVEINTKKIADRASRNAIDKSDPNRQA